MEELTFKELSEAQQDIVSYKDKISAIIGYVDESGNRKIKPEHFLSGEVAAYKLLSSWEKKMLKGEHCFIDRRVLMTLREIGWLIEFSLEGDFADSVIVSSYEDSSCVLWMELLEDKDSSTNHAINVDVIVTAAAALMFRDVPDEENDFLQSDYSDAADSEFLSYAYSVAHEWLLSLPQDIFEKMMKDTEIYRLHFHLLD